jgi:hypothetical protein
VIISFGRVAHFIPEIFFLKYIPFVLSSSRGSFPGLRVQSVFMLPVRNFPPTSVINTRRSRNYFTPMLHCAFMLTVYLVQIVCASVYNFLEMGYCFLNSYIISKSQAYALSGHIGFGC